MRIEAALSIADLRELARRCLPRAVFDFFDGDAEVEITLRRNSVAFQSIEFLPRVMVDVATRDHSALIHGVRAELPLIIAPTGLAALGWPRADSALARASRFGIPFVANSSSSVAAANGTVDVFLDGGVRRGSDVAKALSSARKQPW